MSEKIEERVRNMVGPFYNMAAILNNFGFNENQTYTYIKNNASKISNTMNMSIEYLIDMAHIIDQYLPDDFDINKLLNKEKYHINI